MSYAISFSGKIFVLTVVGECHPNEVALIVVPIIKNLNSEANKLLIDFREVTNLTTMEEVREYVSIFENIPFMRAAIAVTNPTNFDMAHMVAAYSEMHNHQEISVFYDIEKAQEWLSC